MKEIWKEVIGYEDIYLVSSYGRIKRKTKSPKSRADYLAGSTNGRGYRHVCLRKNNKERTHLLHRIIAIAFIPNPKNKRTVNHKDGNKLNNHIDNLEWCTHYENNMHAIKNGLCNYESISKLTEAQVKKIRSLKLSQNKLSRMYNVTQSAIWAIRNRKTWKNI